MRKAFLAVLSLFLSLTVVFSVFADETETFTAQKPDVLLIVDGSGSMLFTPTASDCRNEGGSSYSCGGKVYGNSNCDNATFGSYNSTDSERNTDCRKIAIARRAIAKILDDQEAKQRVRMGFMGFRDCSSTSLESGGNATNPRSGGSYNWGASGCNRLRIAISDDYTDGSDNVFESIKSSVDSFYATGGTPLVGSIAEAKKYFQDYTDAAKSCRTKFVILLSDGDDTFACPYDGPSSPNAYGSENQKDQYKRRRESVAAVKALYDAFAASGNAELREQKIKTFVIGFGANMNAWSINTLNWMAYYGHTSFSATPTGNVNAYKLNTMLPTDLYPYNSSNVKVTACQNSTTSPAWAAPCDWKTTGCMTADTLIDPARNALGGYAFMAANAAQLDSALASAFKVIESTYAFATSSVQSVRTKDENYIYEASFSVRNNDPFYVGHLKQYAINEDGTIPTNYVWDAGEVLKTNNSRNIWTYTGGGYREFNITNIGVTALGVTTMAEATNIIDFIINGDVAVPADDFNGWKLGETFHSYPVTIGSPATYFCDKVDPTGSCSNNIDCTLCPSCSPAGDRPTCEKAFDIFRGYHQRTTTLGNRMIVTGANDGQLHMFNTTNGSERWSFIPPNMLSRLQLITHQAHPETTKTHTYFVDGPISISDVWVPASGSTAIGVAKIYSDWHTWMVFGEGRGASDTLWSSSASCDSGLSPYYSITVSGVTTTYPYYCGYYAFDMTNVETGSTPGAPRWILGGTLGSTSSAISATDAPYLGEPWSKMIMYRVRNGGNEQWVGFFGGGYSDCTVTDNASCATRGKGFFVADLKTGTILKRFSHAASLSMDYQLVSPPSAVDTDNDGFVDQVYMGDLGNNVWRFKFCLAADDTSGTCGTGTSGRWISTALLSSSTHYRKIYTQAAVTRDNAGNMWVYVGTGDKMNPTASGLVYRDRLYAIMDNDLTSTWNLSNLKDISSTTFSPSTDTCSGVACRGWYINLTIGDGEKILAEPVVFQGVVYFTTYVPPGADPCNQSGTAYLYAIDYVTGAGRFDSGDRSEFIGHGIPSAPLVSMNPYGGTDIYVSTSQKTTQTADTFVKKQITPTMVNYNKTNLMMWRDRRVQ